MRWHRRLWEDMSPEAHEAKSALYIQHLSVPRVSFFLEKQKADYAAARSVTAKALWKWHNASTSG